MHDSYTALPKFFAGSAESLAECTEMIAAMS